MGEQGKSLMELVVVTGLIVVMVTVTGQGLVSAVAKHHGNAVATELAAELRVARYLAIMRRERIRVVFEPDAALMRIEPADAAGRTIREYDFKQKGVTIERLSNGPSIVFQPSGRAASATTITLRNRQDERWQLTVSLLGRVSQI